MTETSRLVVIYDPEARLILPSGSDMGGYPPSLKCAALDVPSDLAGRDIYEVARRLAELLLEQLP